MEKEANELVADLMFILLSCSLLVAYSKSDDAPVVTEKQEQLEQPSNTEKNYSYFRRFNKLTNNLRQCFCFLQKPTGVPVTQKLNPNGENLERLVVYVYKDVSSDDFKMYLPNYEKQLMIPDLALDEGDILEISPSEEIESIFNKYSHLKTNREQVDTPDIAQIIDPETFNQNVQDISGEVESNNPSFLDEEKSSSHLQSSTQVPVNNDASPSEQQLNIGYPNNQITPDEGDQDNVTYEDLSEANQDPQLLNDNIEYDSSPNKGLDTSQDQNEILDDTDFQGYAMKVIQLNQSFDLNPKPQNPYKLTKDNTVIPNSEHNKFNININLDFNNIDEDQTEPIRIEVEATPEANQHIPNASPQVEVEKPVSYKDQPTWPVSPNSNVVPPHVYPINRPNNVGIVKPTPVDINKITDYIPEQQIIKTITTENPDIWYNPNDRHIFTLHPHKLIQKYQEKEPQDKNEMQDTFDNWLIRQLERVQFADSEASNSIDIYTLKSMIEKTLKKSGFFIAQNGLLVDSKELKIRMANLVLRPILIGNSVEYKKLLKGKVSTFKLPTNLPYLEAVLITSIKPQKIFGIIPLGKTYLPKNYRTPLSLYVEDPPKRGCNKCISKRFRQTHKTEFITPPIKDYYNQYPSNWAPSNYSPYLSKKQSYGVNPIIPGSFPIQRDGLQQESRRVFPFDQINTVIDSLYKVPVTADKVKYLNRPYVVDYNVQPVVTTQTYQTGPVVKYPVRVVTPGFRIIGGNAATSSGTPVSSKGRSGLDTEDIPSVEEK